MIVTHLVCGFVLGLGAGLAGWIIGLPAWAAVLAYILGINLGALASTLATYLFPPQDLSRAEASNSVVGA
jgi:hypothetical protein